MMKKVETSLNEVDRIQTEQIETICIGIISKNMGYHKGANSIAAGEEIFEYISTLSHKQLRNIKKLKKQIANESLCQEIGKFYDEEKSTL